MHSQNQEPTRLRDWLLTMLMNGQVTDWVLKIAPVTKKIVPPI
jgi:hypothetical protein